MKTITHSIARDQWEVSSGQMDGKPLIVRKNTGYKGIIGHNLFPFRAGISFKFLRQENNGLPSNTESSTLNQIEDAIFERFQSNDRSLVAIIITTNGFREYVMYTQSQTFFNQDLRPLQNEFPNYLFTSYLEEDKNWEGYQNS